MPRVHLTKSAIDALPILAKDSIYWDQSLPGFGVKVTPKGRKVFMVLYRAGGQGSRLRKYTIGPYGRITLAIARGQAQKIFAARVDGRDLPQDSRTTRVRPSDHPCGLPACPTASKPFPRCRSALSTLE